MKILVVDDDPMIRLSTADLLRAEGHKTELASNGAQCLALVQKQHFDIIICDLNMPAIDGMEVLRRLSGKLVSTVFVMVTAVNDVPQAVEAMQLGASNYIVKPITEEQLLDAVQQAKDHLNEQIHKHQILRTVMDNLQQLGGGALDLADMANNDTDSSDVASHQEQDEADIVTYKDLTIDQSRLTVWVNQNQLHLTPREFGIIWILAQAQGKVVTYQQLVSTLEDEYLTVPDARSLLASHVTNLRKKLEQADASLRVVNKRGVGFLLAQE